jgi:hypothetical protein
VTYSHALDLLHPQETRRCQAMASLNRSSLQNSSSPVTKVGRAKDARARGVGFRLQGSLHFILAGRREHAIRLLADLAKAAIRSCYRRMREDTYMRTIIVLLALSVPAAALDSMAMPPTTRVMPTQKEMEARRDQLPVCIYTVGPGGWAGPVIVRNPPWCSAPVVPPK